MSDVKKYADTARKSADADDKVKHSREILDKKNKSEIATSTDVKIAANNLERDKREADRLKSDLQRYK